MNREHIPQQYLLEERVVELRLDPLGGDPAGGLELLGRDADVLHVRPEHEVHEVLVLVVDLLVLGLVLVRVRFED